MYIYRYENLKQYKTHKYATEFGTLETSEFPARPIYYNPGGKAPFICLTGRWMEPKLVWMQ
jgi:hypothetical protein